MSDWEQSAIPEFLESIKQLRVSSLETPRWE